MINIVLYQPEIPNNTGNIIRICIAVGAKLHLIEPLGFEVHPKWFKRAAAGRYLSDIEHEIHFSWEDFELKYGHQKLIFLTRYGHVNYADYVFEKSSKDFMIVFGKESTGIPKSILQKNFAHCLRIPMKKGTRSLNLANSVILVSYEILRQIGFGDLSLFEDQKGPNWLLK